MLVAIGSQTLEFSLPGGAGISFHDGVLRIRIGGDASEAEAVVIPPIGTRPPPSIIVRDTGTVKGFGAFATAPLEKGSFVGFYEGNVVQTREMLDATLYQRARELQSDEKFNKLPSNAMDYVMALDGGMTFLDGYERAMDRTIFSPVHLNHADKGTR